MRLHIGLIDTIEEAAEALAKWALGITEDVDELRDEVKNLTKERDELQEQVDAQ